MSEFWEDTAVERLGEFHLRGTIADRWSVNGIPNGGYLMSLAARALAEVLSHHDPLTLTGHYVEKASVGPADLWVELIREGNTVSTGALKLVQEGRERVRFTATYGDLSTTTGVTWVGDTPPDIDRNRCLTSPRFLAIHERVELLFSPVTADWLRGKSRDAMDHELMAYFRDGTEPDVLSLPFFADCVPPTTFTKFGAVGWVPTLELTVHIRAKPAPGLLTGRFRTRYLINGLMEEDGELWDSNGDLVALSRQLAKYRGGQI
ncbi:MAG: thioesterase family protein [Pseudomonadota bacterium]|nr:thioesterase family protein [Pseudomonadota bacterium]